jgi:hypothetical protein
MVIFIIVIVVLVIAYISYSLYEPPRTFEEDTGEADYQARQQLRLKKWRNSSYKNNR